MDSTDRRRLLRGLREGRWNAAELAARAGVSVPTVMRWIRRLRAEGLRISAGREGRRWAYRLHEGTGGPGRPSRVRGLPVLPARPRDAHKGSVGRILIAAGSRGMAGAAALAARAAYRAGAGLVYLAVPNAILDVLAVKLTETVLIPCGRDAFREADVPTIEGIAGKCRAVAIGPGLSRRRPVMAFAGRIFRTLPLPMVVDADALGAVGPEHAAARILTPHEGEMASLLGIPRSEVSADRADAARRAACRFGAIVILKGDRTIVTDGRRTHVNRTGNPGLATAGTGDVLTGILAALLGQGLSPWDAAVLGPWLHGRAGDLAAAAYGPVSMIASDVIEFLPEAVREQAAR